MHERRPHNSGVWLTDELVLLTGKTASAWRYGRIRVISELADMELPRGGGIGPTWLVSLTRNGRRPRRADVVKVRRAFGMRDAEVDNHHPGNAIHLYLPVDSKHRVDCECKEDEQVIIEPDGYTWTTPREGPCRGCELVRLLGGSTRCPLHQGPQPLASHFDGLAKATRVWWSAWRPYRAHSVIHCATVTCMGTKLAGIAAALSRFLEMNLGSWIRLPANSTLEREFGVVAGEQLWLERVEARRCWAAAAHGLFSLRNRGNESGGK